MLVGNSVRAQNGSDHPQTGKANSAAEKTAQSKQSAGLTGNSPNQKLQSVGLGEAKWTSGFWFDRFETLRKNSLPAMNAIMFNDAPGGGSPSQYLQNFRVASGKVEGKRRGASFNDGDFYKYLESLAAVYAVTKDPQLDKQMDEAIEAIAAAQRPDGYWQTAIIVKQREGDKEAEPFKSPTQFEAYNLGHLQTAACVHFRATGKTSLLDVAKKATDFFISLVNNPTPQLARCAICPSHYMGTVELYRTTGDEKYLRLAAQLIELRDMGGDGTDDNQDRIPFRRQREAMGHAVRANYLYAGAADIYAATGDKTLLTPLETIWKNVVDEKLYITGACGALFDGASPDGSSAQSQIGRIHQAYGRDYQLPNSTAHNETCAAIGNALWNWRMLEISGEAKYADVLETTLYNALLAGESLDGRKFFYTNTLRQLDTMPVDLRWSRVRQSYFSSFCCPPNVLRTMAEINNYAYGKIAKDHVENGICVNLYGASVLETTLNGEKIKLTQETNYPWEGHVKITIDAAPKNPFFSMMFRIPGWVRDAKLAVNGVQSTKRLEPGEYLELLQDWKPGTVVELDFPMPPQLIEANPLVEEARNQVAVQRGPLVYCLESTDLPAETKLQDVLVPHAIELKPRFDASLLGGVTVLEGSALASVEPKWEGKLYRTMPAEKTKPIDLKLIPYYAWCNRGKSEMTVWLPLAR
ncbi:MAG TPA: glycoside hydrolase family 127 protein [Pirellulales bacterium]